MIGCITRNQLVRSNENSVSALQLTQLNNIKLENKIEDSSNDYSNIIKEFKDKIVNGMCPVEVKLEQNQRYIDQVMEYAKKIPTVDIPSINFDISVPQFEKLEIEKDDNKEIKDIIRKINRKTQIFTCDHSSMEKKTICYGSDALKLRKSQNLKKIDEFYKILAEYCWRINEKDKIGKEFKHYNFLLSTDTVEPIIEASMNFSSEVLKFNATYHGLHCSKCEKLMKEFEFTKDDIEERREEIKNQREEEIRKIQKEVENGSSEILDFMEKYFPDVKRINIMQIVKMWKVVFKTMIKKDEVKMMLEETEESAKPAARSAWKVTNVHNVLWASKI